MSQWGALFCGVVLLLGCCCHHQRDRSTRLEKKEVKCTFDDNQLSSDPNQHLTVSSNTAYVWENGEIPYYFNFNRNIRSSRKKSRNRKLIEKAMRAIETRTCFRFLKLNSEPFDKHHLEIRIGEPSCKGKGFSAGVRIGGPYKLVMESEWQLADCTCCLDWHDGVLHELMHVLGVMHTQKRKDRDEHIIINEENIMDIWKAKYQYEVCEGCNSYGVPYDCSSIMHYGTGTYGKDGKDTMTAKDDSTCELTRAGAAFDGRGATKTDWELLDIIAKKACSGPTTYDPPTHLRPNVTQYDPYRPLAPFNPQSEDCITDGGPDSGSPCVFPFVYEAGKTYNKCTFKDADYGQDPWCSTKTDKQGNHIGGKGYYGTCSSNCEVDWVIYDKYVPGG